jgi:hypothetical protein
MSESFGEICGNCGVSVVGDTKENVERRMDNHRSLAHAPGRPFPIEIPASTRIRDAANALADARVRYAREYARIRLLNPEWTDKRCLLAATEETNDEVTRLEAELEIARRTT